MGEINGSVVLIELGGRELKLCYNLHALSQIKALTGKNLMGGEVDIVDPEILVAVIWAGLLKFQPEYDGDIDNGKPDQSVKKAIRGIGQNVDIPKLQEISGAIRRAFAKATGGSDSEAEEKKD